MNLQELFDYDYWANNQWLPVAEAMNQTHVIAHILFSSQVWLARVKHVEADLREDLPLDVRCQESAAMWKALLSDVDLTQRILYTRFDGESHTDTVEEIAQHVINHGTYHRGQLRGIAEERGVEFPETDLIKYIRLLKSPK